MRITTIGFTSLKGGRHRGRPWVELTLDGPVGDRAFCLVDPARERVLRTVENPSMLATSAEWAQGVLTLEVGGRTLEGGPAPTGEELKVDYWGRTAVLEVVDGPWAGACSAHLGFDVVLARPVHPGEVVYGASLSLVTTGSLALLEERLGARVDPRRFRATFVVETAAAHVEDDWAGKRLRVGTGAALVGGSEVGPDSAEIEVRSVMPRCAVVDLDPDTGRRDLAVLATLAGYRLDEGEIGFGIDAVVTRPGLVRPGATVTLERG